MRKSLFILLLLFSFGSFAQTPVDSSSIEMATARAFVEALNDPDIEAMREFTLNYRTKKALARTPIEKRLKSYQSLKDKMGTLEMGPIDKFETGSIKVFVYASKIETWFKMGFKLGEEDKLESLSMMPTKDPNRPGKTLNVKQQLQKLVTDGTAPGVAIVTVKNGKIHKSAVYGVRNATTKQSIQANDPFHLGSVTKSFTASLIGHLIDEGKLTLDSKLEDIFPFEMHGQYRTVTIRSIMAHEGGFPGYLTDEDEDEEARLLSLPGSPRDQRLAFVKELLIQKPTYQPNDRMNYSNAGYSVLAAICEYVADQSWEELLHSVIFQPLKMKSAGIGWPTEIDASFPEGHEDSGQVQNINEYFIGPYLDPAGDLHCSMKDLAKYAIAHLNGLNGKDDFLSANAIKMIHEPKDGSAYAGGWMIEKTEGNTIYHHAGTAGTFFSYIALNPANNSAYVIAANSGNLALLGIFREIIKL